MRNWLHDPITFAPVAKLGGGWIAFKDSPSPPPAPDYTGAAQAQGAANREAAIASAKLSNPNITSPYGNQTVTYGTPSFDQAAYDAAMAKYNQGRPTGPAPTPNQFTRTVNISDDNGGGNFASVVDQDAYNQALAAYNAGGGPPPTREQFTTVADELTPNIRQTLTPVAQQTLDKQQQVQLGLAGVGQQGVGNVSQVLGTPFQFNGPSVQTGIDTSNVARMPVNAGQTGQDAIMARLQPLQDRQLAQQQTALRNQGLAPGSEAYTNAMTDFLNQQNDLRTQAALQGINLDMSANAQGFNQGLQSAQFGNTAQQQALSQALTQRQLPLNEVTALMSGSQIQNPSFPGYNGANVQAAPVMQAMQNQAQGNMNLYNAQQGAANSFNSGLMGMLGTGAGMYAGSKFAPWNRA